MKKFFAIVLGLALVLGFASVASAELKASGELNLQWVYQDGGYTCNLDTSDDNYLSLTASNAWGDAYAEAVFKYNYNSDDLALDSYKFDYKFSDQFTLTAAKSFEVKTPIWDDASVIAADITTQALSGAYTFEGGWFKAATDLLFNQPDLAAAAEVAFDPVTVGGVVDYDGAAETTRFGVYAKYAVTEEITVTADMYFDDPKNDIAFKAEYNGDPFTAAATIKYDIDGEDGLYEYKVEGSFAATEALKLSASYTGYDVEDAAYEVKAALTINEGPVLSVAYNQTEALTANLEIKF